MGSSIFSLGATAASVIWQVTGGTVNAGTSTIILSVASANTRTFAGGGQTYGTITYTVPSSTGSLSLTGSNTFDTINVSGGTRSLLFTASTTTTVSNFNVFGTAGNLVTLGSITAANHNLVKTGGVVSSDYLSISRSQASPSLTWYAGANSTDGGNNSGWIFTVPPSSFIPQVIFMG